MSTPRYPLWSWPWSDERLGEQERARLFSDTMAIKVAILPEPSRTLDSPVLLDISSDEKLEDILTTISVSHGDPSGARSALFFLSQSYSWGRIRIPAEAFQRLISRIGAMPTIYSCIRAFGQRVDDSDTNFQSYFRRIGEDRNFVVDGAVPQPDVNIKPRTAEFGFNIRYPAKHGREANDPWVIRQLLVYQKHNLASGASSWIFVQCPPNLRESILASAAFSGDAVYSAALSFAVSNWREYINHLEEVVKKKADKVCFSRPGLPSETDYQTSFADAQLLHQYSHIIIKAKQTLNSTLRMLLAMCQHQDQLATAGDNASACEFRAVLEWCREQLEVHREGVYALEKHADQTMELLLRLLDHRRDVQMGQTGDVIRRDGMKMHAIAGSAGATLEEARSLLGSSAKHSERLGRLGWIATIYLPASFAAGLFNSGIIRLGSDADPDSGVRVSKGVWVYLAFTGLLTLATLAAIFDWKQLITGGFHRSRQRVASTGV